KSALRIIPDYSDALNNLGNALVDVGSAEEAIEAYRQALRVRPDLAEAWNNLGHIFRDQARLDESIEAYRRAADLRPANAVFHSILLFMLQYHRGYDASAIYRKNRQWNERHAKPLSNHIKRHKNESNPNRRLRLGFISPDFRSNCLSFFTIPLLYNLD